MLLSRDCRFTLSNQRRLHNTGSEIDARYAIPGDLPTTILGTGKNKQKKSQPDQCVFRMVIRKSVGGQHASPQHFYQLALVLWKGNLCRLQILHNHSEDNGQIMDRPPQTFYLQRGHTQGYVKRLEFTSIEKHHLHHLHLCIQLTPRSKGIAPKGITTQRVCSFFT